MTNILGAQGGVLGDFYQGYGVGQQRLAEQKKQALQGLSQQYLGASGQQQAVLGNQLNAASPELYKNILGNQTSSQELEQKKMQQEKDAHAMGAFNVLNAKDKKQAYARYRNFMISSGFETPQDMPENYDDVPEGTFEQLLNEGRDIKDLTTTAQQDRDFTLRERELVSSREDRNLQKQAVLGEKQRVQNERDLQKLADRVDKTGITDVITSIKNLENLIPEEGNIEGMSGASALTPDFLSSDKGQAIRQEVAGLRNVILKARSGGAVTPQEAERLLTELGTGVFKNDTQLRRGIANVKKTMETKIKSTFAGFSHDVVDEYKGRGGISLESFNTSQESGKGLPQGTKQNQDGTFTLPDGRVIRKKQ